MANVLDPVIQTKGLPQRIKVDNGPAFISKALDAWAYFNHIQLDYSRPGTPADNAIIESFNGSFRDECLNTNWFLSLADARDQTGRWKDDYNELRPHSSLTYLTPADFARKQAAASQEKREPFAISKGSHIVCNAGSRPTACVDFDQRLP